MTNCVLKAKSILISKRKNRTSQPNGKGTTINNRVLGKIVEKCNHVTAPLQRFQINSENDRNFNTSEFEVFQEFQQLVAGDVVGPWIMYLLSWKQ